ncbi:lipoprotein-releasing ABC transporter permease subunit [candidate division KSB1 bacterium]|nr:lipoprotein-releasing ABC transporter permease subunit [candidate division KSB1 bacterium]
MSYELFIALRYLKSKRKTGFISLITYISVAGVVIGVAALIIVLSVMNGFEKEVRSRFIGVDAHVHVRTFHDRGVENVQNLADQLKNLPHVQAWSPYIFNKGLIRSRESTTGVLVRGIDPVSAVEVTDIGKNINFGELDVGPVPVEGEATMPGIILGFNLADKLIVTLGDKVTIASFSGVTQFGQMPMMMQFRVTGYFETGLYEIDDNFAYISIESAQKLFRMGDKVSGLELRLDNYENAATVADLITSRVGYPYRAITWQDMNPNLFAWMKIEKWAAFVILSLIIMVAAFNIVSTLIMVTMEKTKEIGILKSMGATGSSIRLIFTFEGLFVGIVGTLLGNVIGFALCWAQQTYKWFALPSDVYIISWLPVLMKWSDFAMISAAALLITFVASVYPAAHAAKLDPVEALRYE